MQIYTKMKYAKNYHGMVIINKLWCCYHWQFKTKVWKIFGCISI